MNLFGLEVSFFQNLLALDVQHLVADNFMDDVIIGAELITDENRLRLKWERTSDSSAGSW